MYIGWIILHIPSQSQFTHGCLLVVITHSCSSSTHLNEFVWLGRIRSIMHKRPSRWVNSNPRVSGFLAMQIQYNIPGWNATPRAGFLADSRGSCGLLPLESWARLPKPGGPNFIKFWEPMLWGSPILRDTRNIQEPCPVPMAGFGGWILHDENCRGWLADPNWNTRRGSVATIVVRMTRCIEDQDNVF